MEEFKAFKKEELENSKVFAKLSKLIEEALTYGYAGIGGEKISEIIKLRIRLEKSLPNLKPVLLPETYVRYENLLKKIKFFTLEDLTKKEIEELYKNHILFAHKEELIALDLENKLRAKLLNMPYKQRDPFLADLRRALKQNEELLGEKDIRLGPEEKKEKPYLKNWLKDYELTVGAGKHGKMEISDYLFKSPNARRLTSEERELLRKILEFYEKLKLEITDPDALSSYSLSTFGIKSVGTGFKRRFMPAYSAVPVVKVKPKIPLVKAAPPRPVLSKEKISATRPVLRKRVVPSVKIKPGKPEEMIVDLRKKREKEIGGAKPISPVSLAKLKNSKGLALLTLEDFRSFGKDAKAAAGFLLSRIKKLAQISSINRLACRDNLRKSALYKLYLEQGKESLDRSKAIDEIAEIRKSQGRPYLTEEEYKAVESVFKAI